jgi:hypothetical protein
MNEEQRSAAIARREEQQAAAGTTPAGNARNTGLSGCVMPSGGFPGAGRGQRPAGQTPQGQGPAGETRPLWFIDESAKLDLIMVRTGISDGSFTEILPVRSGSEEELAGKRIILREKI